MHMRHLCGLASELKTAGGGCARASPSSRVESRDRIAGSRAGNAAANGRAYRLSKLTSKIAFIDRIYDNFSHFLRQRQCIPNEVIDLYVVHKINK